jgi:thioredoxin reductase (NADPH)
MFEIGQVGAPAFLVLAGSIEVARRDPLGSMSAIATQGPGELTGEISQLAGGPSLAEGRAGANGATVAPFDSAQLRNLVVGTAELGETLMRAFILRRAFLIESGTGVVLLGASDTPEVLAI